MSILKIYLPLYIVLYLFLAFVWPSYRTFKRTGINPVTFGKSDNAHDYIGFVMKLLFLLLFLAVMMFSISGKAYHYLAPIDYLEVDYLKITGLIIIHIALLWICIAQFQMGKSWRIGIDEKHKTGLVTMGVFSVSRNPIFLGMNISMLGLFFIMPNAITFFLALCTYFIIHIQIRLEEAFLKKQHGMQYEIYQQKTKRFL